MRLTGAGRRKGLTLVPGAPRERQVLGLAESVARAVTLGPGVLPTGVADAVPRLAFGRATPPGGIVDGAAVEPQADAEHAHLLDFLQARAARASLIRWPRHEDGA